MNKADINKLTARGLTTKSVVLIIEDNLAQQKLYSLIAEQVGMIPWIVSTPAEGIEAAQFLAFNLIILDLQMPSSNGIECAKEIQKIERRRGARTPIIAVTAHAMLGDREKCIEAGMDDYMSKPFTLDTLRDKIAIWAA